MRYLIILILLLSSVTQAQLNPKSFEEMTAVINLGGTLVVTGNIKNANLSLHIPQEGVENLVVTGADSWGYIYDEFDNQLLLLEWQNPKGSITYDVKITVKNRAKHFTNLGGIGTDDTYLSETESIVFNDGIRAMAFPYERTWERVAELTTEVHELLDYDINLVGERKDSTWVLENKRGVCVEHANLLAALLRVSNIPTRYVVGYAFSTVDDKLIGHTWVEVLNDRGEWVPFDPTWLQGGYIDATHIKTANRIDDNQIDVLRYFGNGNIQWEKSEEGFEIATQNLTRDKVDILNYKLSNITEIITEPGDFSPNQYGFSKVTLNVNECTIVDVSAASCVDKDGDDVFEIYDEARQMWVCKPEEIYWFFDIKESGFSSYTCPINVYDQIGSSQNIEINVRGTRVPDVITLSGPNKVKINENFALEGDGLLYSPDFGVIKDDISISVPGKYNFYLYAGGALMQKEVEVVESRQFSVGLIAPENLMLNSSFIATVRVVNEGEKSDATVRLLFDNEVTEVSQNFNRGEEKEFTFNVTAKSSGIQKMTAEVISESFDSYTVFIAVEAPPEDGPGAVSNFLTNFFTAITDFFRGIFG